MDREQPIGKQLFCSEEMGHIGPAEATAGAAIARGIHGLLLVQVPAVAQVDSPPGDPRLAVARDLALP